MGKHYIDGYARCKRERESKIIGEPGIRGTHDTPPEGGFNSNI